MSSLPTQQLASIKASRTRRLVAFFVDWLLTIPLDLIGLIPVVGQFISLACLLIYWLFRDINGASIGKRLFGLRVVDRQGRTPALGKRVRRNFFFAVTAFLAIIPVFGAVVSLMTVLALGCIEFGLLLLRGETFADWDSKCLVVRRVLQAPGMVGSLHDRTADSSEG